MIYMENKGTKKGFWATLFSPKRKYSHLCGCQIEDVKDEKPSKLHASSCECETTGDEQKELIVLGTGCASCKALYTTVQEAVQQLGINATVEKEENLAKIMEYNVMSLPALVIDGKVVAKGQKLTLEQVKKLIG